MTSAELEKDVWEAFADKNFKTEKHSWESDSNYMCRSLGFFCNDFPKEIIIYATPYWDGCYELPLQLMTEDGYEIKMKVFDLPRVLDLAMVESIILEALTSAEEIIAVYMKGKSW